MMCSICYESSDEPVARLQPCGHEFHAACVLPWLWVQKMASCPCCRRIPRDCELNSFDLIHGTRGMVEVFGHRRPLVLVSGFLDCREKLSFYRASRSVRAQHAPEVHAAGRFFMSRRMVDYHMKGASLGEALKRFQQESDGVTSTSIFWAAVSYTKLQTVLQDFVRAVFVEQATEVLVRTYSHVTHRFLHSALHRETPSSAVDWEPLFAELFLGFLQTCHRRTSADGHETDRNMAQIIGTFLKAGFPVHMRLEINGKSFGMMALCYWRACFPRVDELLMLGYEVTANERMILNYHEGDIMMCHLRQHPMGQVERRLHEILDRAFDENVTDVDMTLLLSYQAGYLRSRTYQILQKKKKDVNWKPLFQRLFEGSLMAFDEMSSMSRRRLSGAVSSMMDIFFLAGCPLEARVEVQGVRYGALSLCYGLNLFEKASLLCKEGCEFSDEESVVLGVREGVIECCALKVHPMKDSNLRLHVLLDDALVKNVNEFALIQLMSDQEEFRKLANDEEFLRTPMGQALCKRRKPVEWTSLFRRLFEGSLRAFEEMPTLARRRFGMNLSRIIDTFITARFPLETRVEVQGVRYGMLSLCYGLVMFVKAERLYALGCEVRLEEPVVLDVREGVIESCTLRDHPLRKMVPAVVSRLLPRHDTCLSPLMVACFPSLQRAATMSTSELFCEMLRLIQRGFAIDDVLLAAETFQLEIYRRHREKTVGDERIDWPSAFYAAYEASLRVTKERRPSKRNPLCKLMSVILEHFMVTGMPVSTHVMVGERRVGMTSICCSLDLFVALERFVQAGGKLLPGEVIADGLADDLEKMVS